MEGGFGWWLFAPYSHNVSEILDLNYRICCENYRKYIDCIFFLNYNVVRE